MKREKLQFGGAWMVPAILLLATTAMAQPPIAVPVKPTDAEPETRQPMAPPMSLAELEKFIGGRTLLTLKLQNATLEEVAVAMSQSSGLDIAVRPTPKPFAPPNRPDGQPGAYTPPPTPRFTLEAKEQPFWEALLAWQRGARTSEPSSAQKRVVVLPNSVSYGVSVPSPGLQRSLDGFWLQDRSTLSEGRGLAVWPSLFVATSLTRNQQAFLDANGLREIATTENAPPLLGKSAAPVAVAPVGAAPEKPQPEAERWADRLTLNMQAYIDPKIRPTALRCDIEEAIDDKGNDLRWTASRDVSRAITNPSMMGGSTGTPLNISLRSQPGMGKRLVKLRGVLRVVVVTRSQHWETTQLQTLTDGSIWQDGGEFQVQFKGLEKQGDGWSVKFAAESRGTHLKRLWEQVRFRGLGETGWRVLEFDDSRMRLIDENGRSFESSGESGSRGLASGKGEQVSANVSPPPPDIENYTYNEVRAIGFRKPFDLGNSTVIMGRPVKLIVDFPREKREVIVPFEFTDLPLPPS